jgi:hypothetical protein
MADPKCDGRVNFRGMWGQVGIREQAVRPPDEIHVNQTAFGNVSGILVCQPGPLLGKLARHCAAGLYADIARWQR